MTMHRTAVAALAALPLLFSGARADVAWLPGDGQSCADVCGMKRMAPVVSGTWKNGNDLYVCSANQAGEGWRAGFNLKPLWANVCMVPYGGKEFRATSYRCACE